MPRTGTDPAPKAAQGTRLRSARLLSDVMALRTVFGLLLPDLRKQVDCAPLMGRLSAAALVVGMTWLALDGAAAAQACTCGEPVDDMSRADRIASLSEELELLSEAVEAGEAVGPAIDLGSLVQGDDDDLPWCINQNDAQCSK